MSLADRDATRERLTRARLMYEHPAVFMSMLVDDRGHPFVVEEFHERYLTMFEEHDRAVVLAPRGHGKTTVIVAYMLWHCWRHNRHPDTGRLLDGLPDGRWEAVLFSATMEQVSHIFELFKSLMLANELLFADVLPNARRSGRAAIRDVWSQKKMLLRNRAEVSIRAYGTATRGLHPHLILLDDVLSDENSGNSYQRDQTYKYFMGTMVPMDPTKLIIIGTAFHFGDLLHRLKPKETTDTDMRQSRFRFVWHKDRALDTEAGMALWPAKYSVEDLLELREQDPVSFSREYQNDPADDAASMFPYSLTERMVDEKSGFARRRRPDPTQEIVVLGYDPAASAETGADYCCLFVIAVDKQTLRRRVLWAYRERGLGFDEQLQLLRDVCRDFGVAIGMVEDNGFQRWLKVTAGHFPETAGRIFGHTTGREKRSFEDGIPSLKIALKAGLWDGALPTGDDEGNAFAAIFRTECAAFTWKDGKPQGVGEHDDTVHAWWFADIAARSVAEYLQAPLEDEIVTMEDLGIERVNLGDY